MNFMHNFFRRARSLVPTAVARFIRSTKIPLVLFGVCCYQFYHYQRISSFGKPITRPRQVTLQPFSDQLYDSISSTQNVIVLMDFGYTEEFTSRLQGILSQLKTATAGNPRKLRILTLELRDRAHKQQFEKRHGISISPQTIFLIKNQYSQKLQDFSFEDVMSNPRALTIYFSEVPILNQKQRHKLCDNIRELTHNEFLLLFYCDKNDKDYGEYERVFKNIELAVAENPLNTKAILMMINQPEHLKDFQLEGATAGSLHLMKKYSKKHSLQQPNAELCGKQFHQMRDIKLLGKDGQLLLGMHLDKIDTFSNILRDYEVKLVVDRNRITKDTYRNLVHLFQKLKAEKVYPNVGFSLKFDRVVEKEGPFMIKAIDHKKYTRSMDVLEGKVTDPTERAELGRHTYEYLLAGDNVSEQTLREFITKVLEGSWPQHFRSAKVHPLASLDRLNAKNFEKKVINDSSDHLVLQYSSHCSGCKTAAPFLIEFANNSRNSTKLTKLGNVKVHRLNSIKNDILGQVQYPYTPVLLFYKNGWKPKPIQFDLETLMNNPTSLSDFCEVTAEVGPLSEKLLAEHYSSAKEVDFSSLLSKA